MFDKARGHNTHWRKRNREMQLYFVEESYHNTSRIKNCLCIPQGHTGNSLCHYCCSHGASGTSRKQKRAKCYLSSQTWMLCNCCPVALFILVKQKLHTFKLQIFTSNLTKTLKQNRVWVITNPFRFYWKKKSCIFYLQERPLLNTCFSNK